MEQNQNLINENTNSRITSTYERNLHNQQDSFSIDDFVLTQDNFQNNNNLKKSEENQGVCGVELLECPICCELFNNATETSCGHAFCEFCINKCLEKNSICPVCRKNCSPVRPSFTLRKIVDEYRKVKGLVREEVYPKSVNEEKSLGNTAYQNSEFAEAITHYSKAIDLSPSAILYGNRAACYFKLKQYHLALEDCEKAIHLEPRYVKVWVRKAFCYEQLKEYDEAYKCFKHAQSLDKNQNFKDEILQGLQRISRFVINNNIKINSSSPTHPYTSPPPPPPQQQYFNQQPYPFPFQQQNTYAPPTTYPYTQYVQQPPTPSGRRQRNRTHNQDECVIQ